jgi:predicted nucleotidyltransferase
MTKEGLEVLLRTLNDAGVRYLVAGGIAVIAHGYQRMTDDVDLVLAMDDENVLKATGVFERLGYRPRVPVKIHDLADAEKRRQWVIEKMAVVFQLDGPTSTAWPVDIFLHLPFEFEEEWNRAKRSVLTDGLVIPSVSMDTLIAMKEAAGRLKDQNDLLQLRRLKAQQDRDV